MLGVMFTSLCVGLRQLAGCGLVFRWVVADSCSGDLRACGGSGGLRGVGV